MPTKRVRRRRNRVESLSAYQISYLLDCAPPEVPESDVWWRYTEVGCDRPDSPYQARSAGALWRQYRDELMALWLQDHPGCRPQVWWDTDAPRQPLGRFPRYWYDGQLPEPRLQLGGVGTVRADVLAESHCYSLGIPCRWVVRRDLDTFPSLRGRAQPLDPADPPVFEAQAHYLDRYGLFLPGERERLSPEDWAPEVLDLEAVDD
ncbi:MAG TPA: hypothetical protein VHL31_19835 [Geminicoccus sp.]|uniref:hypothetical protein n=1 Tax=Geminicoccus sp. TaxID=2024832 RepID=UPI002E308DB1|nr:hypothetical protein [Geminicoccus sp.]HEX2528534.1 hypothetical protein [Geminicoccus sp.]